MADSAADARVEAQKRRSTRIAQAVPITVTGVDALGRPFQERTSTVVVNCHGFRYQSKHYVLKNTWVTAEVPQRGGGSPAALGARARDLDPAPAHRPRALPDRRRTGNARQSLGHCVPATRLVRFPGAPWLGDRIFAGGSAAVVDNIRILPVGSAVESSSALSQQMSVLLEEAKQELQAAVRESTAQAAPTDTAPLIAALQKQLEQAAEHSVQTIAEAAAKRAVQESLGRTALKTQEHLKNLQRRWNEELEASIQQAGGNLRSRLAESAAGAELLRCAARWKR